MSTSKIKKSSALYLDTTSSSSKYLGESGDRHFRPKSPLISRQRLTPWEEEELVRACTNVLSGVPHSDGDTEPELQHLAAHIIAESPSVKPRTHDSRRSERAYYSQSATRKSAGRPHVQASTTLDDTATPSISSKNDTDVQTNGTTPMTSTEISPQDALTQFSEKIPGVPVSQFADLSRSKRNTKQLQQVYPSIHKASSSQSHSPMVLATKSTTVVSSPSGWSREEHQSRSKPSKGLKKHFVKQPEYNKSLPDVPKIEHFYETVDDPWSTRNASLDLPRRQRTEPVKLPTKSRLNQSTDLSSSEKAVIKTRFPFLSVFGRKKSKT